MHPYALVHLSDTVLLRNLTALVTQERHTTASLIAHIAEVDDRKLYAPAGYSSMHAYCVDELRLSEDAAYKRIQAARAARRFPAIFGAVAEGRLHLSGACLLAPYLTEATADDLLAEAAARRKADIEAMLARRFPVSEVVRPVVAVLGIPQLAPGQVEHDEAAPQPSHASPTDDVKAAELAPGQVERKPSEAPPERYLIQIPVDASTRDKLRYAQALLSHSIPTGDVARVIERALDTLIETLEKRKLGVGRKRKAVTEQRPKPVSQSRHVPMEVRRAVWERDGGQCTFVSASGKRCEARRFLEFDHIDPVARGGVAKVDRVRLRCRTHNQLEAERVFEEKAGGGASSARSGG